MKTDHTLTAERLRELVRYDPPTGTLHWLVLEGNREAGPLGSRAGHQGRLQVHFGGVARYVHRLVWLFHHGEWPQHQIDHMNGDKHDNRIENLRVVENRHNAQNRMVARVDNRSGLMGVSWEHRNGGRWRARIMVDGCSKSLGYFATPEDAHDAYVLAKRELHPFWIESVAA